MKSSVNDLDSYHLDSIELMRNIGSLVLELMVIGNRMLSTLKECGYWRVYDSIPLRASRAWS